MSPEELIERHLDEYADLELVELCHTDWKTHLDELNARAGNLEGPMALIPRKPASPGFGGV